MKILAFAFIISALGTACGGGQSGEHTHEDGTEHEHAVAEYACPMHPEETGVEGDKCGKCGMDLEAVEGK